MINKKLYVKQSNSMILLRVFAMILIFIQVIVTYFIDTQIGIYLIYILIYILSYIMGNNRDIIVSNKKLFLAFGIGIISIITRLLGRILLDDTIIYNVIIVGYTQGILAFSIFYIFIFLGNKIEAKNFIKYIDSISFEIYLCHYMYMVGPIRLMGLTSSFILNTIITLMASIITAIIVNSISKNIYRFIDKISKIKERNIG